MKQSMKVSFWKEGVNSFDSCFGVAVFRFLRKFNVSVSRSFTEPDESESASEVELGDSLEESGEENLIADDSLRSSAAKEDDTLDQLDEDMSSDQSGSEFSDSDEKSTSPAQEGDDITMMSLASLQEDLEKGKAAKEQVCKDLNKNHTRDRIHITV